MASMASMHTVSDDPEWDKIVHDMAVKRGVTDEEMLARLRGAAHQWESRQEPWYRRLWHRLKHVTIRRER